MFEENENSNLFFGFQYKYILRNLNKQQLHEFIIEGARHFYPLESIQRGFSQACYYLIAKGGVGVFFEVKLPGRETEH